MPFNSLPMLEIALLILEFLPVKCLYLTIWTSILFYFFLKEIHSSIIFIFFKLYFMGFTNLNISKSFLYNSLVDLYFGISFLSKGISFIYGL